MYICMYINSSVRLQRSQGGEGVRSDVTGVTATEVTGWGGGRSDVTGVTATEVTAVGRGSVRRHRGHGYRGHSGDGDL